MLYRGSTDPGLARSTVALRNHQGAQRRGFRQREARRLLLPKVCSFSQAPWLAGSEEKTSGIDNGAGRRWRSFRSNSAYCCIYCVCASEKPFSCRHGVDRKSASGLSFLAFLSPGTKRELQFVCLFTSCQCFELSHCAWPGTHLCRPARSCSDFSASAGLCPPHLRLPFL